jgi:hypothetical protein
VSGYTQGRAVEYAVLHDLQQHGYDTVRAASSKGLADVVAIKVGQVLVVNCKRTAMPGPAERADLIRVADCLPGIALPIVALKPRLQQLQYRLLTGAGPKAWAAWTPDEFADGAA